MRIIQWLLKLLGSKIWSWLAPFLVWIAVAGGAVLFMVFAQSVTAMKAIGSVLWYSLWLLGLPLAAVVSIVEKLAAWRAEVSGTPIAKTRPIVSGWITLALLFGFVVLSIRGCMLTPGPNPGPPPGPNPGPQPGPEPQPWDPVPVPSEWEIWFNNHKRNCKQCSRPWTPMCREAREMRRKLTGSINEWIPAQEQDQ